MTISENPPVDPYLIQALLIHAYQKNPKSFKTPPGTMPVVEIPLKNVKKGVPVRDISTGLSLDVVRIENLKRQDDLQCMSQRIDDYLKAGCLPVLVTLNSHDHKGEAIVYLQVFGLSDRDTRFRESINAPGGCA